jgi:endonuclease/exonuclease/phosphatase family metal-dependent hydrolase
MNFKRLIALLLLLCTLACAVACNGADEDNTDGSATADQTEEEPTEKATKKPSGEKATEPPARLEDTEGLDLEIKMLSQNLSPLDRSNGNSIDERFSRFEAMVNELGPDVIATQEGGKEWVGKLKDLKEYGFCGISSYGKRSMGGLWNAILYKKERFVLMDEGDFWVGEDIKSASIAAGAMEKRICSWVELFDRYTGESIVVASSQLDHACETVRQTQLGQLARALKAALGKRYTDMPVYIALDLKTDTYSDTYFDMISVRGYDDVRNLALEDRSEGYGANHFFGNVEKGKDECFWFARGYGEVLSYEIITKKYKGEKDTEAGYVSDHYGILITLGAAQ